MFQFLVINGNALKTPADVTWSESDVSSSDSGRDQTATMRNTVIAQKVKLTCKWNAMPVSDASILLQAVNSSQFSLNYFDIKRNGRRTATFYKGDRSAKIAWLLDTSQVVENVAFDFIEV